MSTENTGGNLQRSIKTRQLTMIAIGGTIGTGLFFASGNTVGQVGPGGAILAYGLMALFVYFMMQGLGEMATQLPISGSFEAYANRFLDPAMGFAIGWNYWFAWAVTVAAELVAGGIVIKFWFPDSNSVLWAMMFFALLMLLNLVSVKSFAEAEYWFAGIKVVTIVIFLVVGLLMIVGIMGGDAGTVGFANWGLDGGEAGKAPFIGGFGAFLTVFLVVGFSFQGTELVGLAAAETADPDKAIPMAIKSVFWRMLLFYIGSIFVVATLIPFTDPQLLDGSVENIAASPFTLIFQHAGFAAAASVMNAVILTSVLSCGNSALFSASRMLYAMAERGTAPRFMAKVNKAGVPYWAVIFTGLIGCLSFFCTYIGEGKIYLMFVNVSSVSGFIIWFGIAACQYRFRKAWLAQGHTVEELKFKSKFYPWGPILAMIFFGVIIFGANYWVFQAEIFSWFDFLTSYAFVPVFAALYFGYKKKNNTHLVPLEECDFTLPEKDK